MNNEKILNISWGGILKIAFVILIFYVLYQIKSILIWLIFALVISILFEPAIDFLKKFKIPRSLAVFSVYTSFFGIFILIIYLVISPLVFEIRQFSHVLPQYFEKTSPILQELGIKAFEDIDTLINTLRGMLEKIVANVFSVFFVIFGGIFATIFILTITVFLSLEEKGVERVLILLFPRKYENYVLSLWEKCQRKVSGWFLVRIIGCLFVGIVSLVVFLLFNVPYPFTLGLLAGILNFIPIVGSIIFGALLFIIIAVESMSKAIFVLIAFILIQQVENSILSPFLSKKFIDLSPVLVLISMAVGGMLFGFLGAILAVPVAGILVEFIKEFLEEKKKSEKSLIL